MLGVGKAPEGAVRYDPGAETWYDRLPYPLGKMVGRVMTLTAVVMRVKPSVVIT